MKQALCKKYFVQPGTANSRKFFISSKLTFLSMSYTEKHKNHAKKYQYLKNQL
jgi:hypothetical protein